MKRKTKQTLKMVALGVVGLGAVVGAASVLGNLRSEDDGLKTIHPTFEVGGLNDVDGKYEESKKTIYTKDAFECQGLEVELDFDNNIKYQVFYYESDGDYISATNVLEGNQNLEVPSLATHARMEITPIWKDDVKEKDQEIKWYQVSKYATQLDIKVHKEQNEIVYPYKGDNKFEYLPSYTVTSYSNGMSTIQFNPSEMTSAYNTCALIRTNGAKNVCIKVNNKALLTDVEMTCLSETAIVQGATALADIEFEEVNFNNNTYIKFTLPEGTEGFFFLSEKAVDYSSFEVYNW